MSKRVVVVIDDDPSVRTSLARLLRVKGFTCKTFSTAEEFLNHFATCNVGCIIIDINLGRGLSGIELCERLRKSDRRLNIVLMTGVSSQQNEKKAMEAGCDAFLAKPFSPHALLDVIDKPVDQHPNF
jgi:two-component system, LuxR family, response regulator FixJ